MGDEPVEEASPSLSLVPVPVNEDRIQAVGWLNGKTHHSPV